jgi:hypothetical protein
MESPVGLDPGKSLQRARLTANASCGGRSVDHGKAIALRAPRPQRAIPGKAAAILRAMLVVTMAIEMSQLAKRHAHRESQFVGLPPKVHCAGIAYDRHNFCLIADPPNFSVSTAPANP